MSKHIRFSADDSQEWDLPEEYDLEEIRRQVMWAIENEALVNIRHGWRCRDPVARQRPGRSSMRRLRDFTTPSRASAFDRIGALNLRVL